MLGVDPEFEALLRERGATDDDIHGAAIAGQHSLNVLAAELLIRPPGHLTLAEVASRSGTTTEQVVRWWRGLGLADPTNGVVFNEDDVEVLQTIAAMASFLPPDSLTDLIRVFGISAQQLAYAGVNAMRVGFEQPMRDAGGSDTAVEVAYGEIVNEIVPGVVQTWGRLFRHHLVASTYEDVRVAQDGALQSVQTITFVDLVDFTGYAQRVEVPELAATLSVFEATASDLATRHGGRLVKLLGDGAMLSFGERSNGIEAARAFVAGHLALPPRRAGVATGSVLTRQGDFYGTVVNLAARLSGAVDAGEVAVDGAVGVLNAPQMEFATLKGLSEPVGFYRVIA